MVSIIIIIIITCSKKDLKFLAAAEATVKFSQKQAMQISISVFKNQIYLNKKNHQLTCFEQPQREIIWETPTITSCSAQRSRTQKFIYGRCVYCRDDKCACIR